VKWNISLACFLVLIIANPVLAQSTISSSFDTDAEGWIGIPGEGSVSYFASGGSPGGHIRVTDIGVGPGLGSGAIAPSQFLGDLSAFDQGSISYDMTTFAGGGATFGIFGTIQITGSGMVVSFDVAENGPPSGVWQSYSAPLVASFWGVTELEWASILSDVTEIAISTDAFDGPESIGVDNFTLAMEPPVAVEAMTWGTVKWLFH
jgi:hypothetical protein